MTKRTVTALLAAALLVGCAGSEDPPASAPSSPTSASPSEAGPVPVLDQDFPDPDLLLVDGTYYAYATQTTRSIDPDMQCIGVASSASPAGPFRPVSEEPLICPEDEGGAIDAASHVEADGTRYLLWKNDGNCCGKDTWLQLHRLSPDGLELDGPSTKLIKQDQTWEGNLIEAPTLVRRDSSYLLFYSANDYGGESYATGYATASKLEGPYEKADEPLVTSAETGVTGPGGQDVISDESGATHLVFHGWDPAVIYRATYVTDLGWNGAVPEPSVGGAD